MITRENNYALTFYQILSNNFSRKVERPVWRICMLILGLRVILQQCCDAVLH